MGTHVTHPKNPWLVIAHIGYQRGAISRGAGQPRYTSLEFGNCLKWWHGEEGDWKDRLSCSTAPHSSCLMIINYICALIQFASFLRRRIVLSHLGIFKCK